MQLTHSSSKVQLQPLPERYQDDPKTRRPDIARAQRLLGWEPKVDRPEGFRHAMDYFRKRLDQQVGERTRQSKASVTA